VKKKFRIESVRACMRVHVCVCVFCVYVLLFVR